MSEYLQKLMEAIQENGKPLDMDKIERAYSLAEQAHAGQTRASGEPYIIHPVETAIITVKLGMDTDTVVTALLHDVVEDTDVPLEKIRKEFGPEVALMVDGVTKLGQIAYVSREEQQAENVRKMLLAMVQDVRVIIVKLADRLHNMRTIDFMPPEKQRNKAHETMEIYAPLAHRLGIRPLMEELEDRCIRVLDPVGYNDIERRMELEKDERIRFLDSLKERISERLKKENQPAYVEGRIKSIYGIYRKVYIQGRSMEEIFDIYAVRVIVESVYECYNVLGIVHDMFNPIPDRFKDYISTPKQNMYQSLHTTCIDKEGIPFEIQIRTWDMHHTAEYGIAAHWKYKAGITGKDNMEERLSWVRQLLEQQQESDDASELVESIKSDIAPDEVFVFTPGGDVIQLPTGSTVIDFAYAIHTAVGNRMTGAKINGRIVSLDSEVKTGMIVEIITTNAPGHGPSRDWISMAKTAGARSKIRTWFKKERRDENIVEGKEAVWKEFRRNLIILEEPQYSEFIEDVARRQHCNSAEDFYASVGYGGINLSKLLPWAKDEFIRHYRTVPDVAPPIPEPPKRKTKNSSGVIVEGLEGCLVKFARCCNPLPGDDIVGYVTRGTGVSIHKANCRTAVAGMESKDQKGRWVHASWSNDAKETYQSDIVMVCQNRLGLVADVSIALTTLHVPVHALSAKETSGGMAEVRLTTETSGVDQLKVILDTLRRIRGVEIVQRV
ncbi:MAG TPA: bifunctional (p)ppGpp synthetase/guanosine-3',5'-bis(diphosphate) 3'-pyrophosphohydrolase [Oscillospiraceae bacterium]|nr:bifunctional (p)ppGpp synthetase/guanosine-3',5'-bis(diphosphate) 3'-pyrophosphohydrolase [Oscillospiraceae bacterium]